MLLVTMGMVKSAASKMYAVSSLNFYGNSDFFLKTN